MPPPAFAAEFTAPPAAPPALAAVFVTAPAAPPAADVTPPSAPRPDPAAEAPAPPKASRSDPAAEALLCAAAIAWIPTLSGISSPFFRIALSNTIPRADSDSPFCADAEVDAEALPDACAWPARTDVWLLPCALA